MDSIAGTSEDDLYLAYQDDKGFWHRHIMTTIDKTSKKLTAQTRHFSDWTLERIFYIKITNDDTYLEANDELGLIAFWKNVKQGTDSLVEAAPIPDKNMETWFTTGPGTFTKPKQNATVFKAPASIPHRNEIAVGLRIRNMVSPRHPDRPGNGGLAIVQIPVILLPEEYFIWTVDGQTISPIRRTPLRWGMLPHL